MKNRILWIEDDYYHIKGLLRPLEKEGFKVTFSTSANDAYQKAQDWRDYEIIIIDMILPPIDEEAELSPEVGKWGQEEYLGVGLLKYIKYELKCSSPIIVLSVAANGLTDVLNALGVDRVLLKRGLLPREVQRIVHEVLARRNNETN